MKKYLFLWVSFIVAVHGTTMGQDKGHLKLQDAKSVASTTAIPEDHSIITWPIEGTVFQRPTNSGSNLTYNLDFAGNCYDDPTSNYSPAFKIFKRQEDGTYTLIFQNSLSAYPNLHYIDSRNGSYAFLLQDFISLSEGWYQIQLYGGGSSRSTVSFGVGDVYFIAGQSNASGYNHQADHIPYPAKTDWTNTNDDTVPYLTGNDSQYQNIMARVFRKDGKFEWFDNKRNRNLKRPVDGIWEGLPFHTKFGILKNVQNKLDTLGYIYPNGMATWYWAPFAHKITKEKKTPVMLFNTAFPGSSLVGGWHPTDQSGDKGNERFKFLATVSLYGNIMGAKAVLWHQGEEDAFKLTNSPFPQNQYKNNLNALIAQSRAKLGGTTNLGWYVSKVSYFTGANGLTNTASFGALNNLGTLNPSASYSGIANKYTHSGITAEQEATFNSGNKVFPGFIASDAMRENYRDDKFRIHFSGDKFVNGKNAMMYPAEEWYTSIYQNNAYTTAPGVGPTKLVKVTSVSRNYNNNTITLTVDTQNNSEYYFSRNDNGVYNSTKYPSSAKSFENTNKNNPTFTFTNVNNNDVFVCYVKDNQGRFHVTQPIPENYQSTSFFTSDELISFDSNGGTKYNPVITSGYPWYIASSPSWLTQVVFETSDVNRFKIVAPQNTSANARSGDVVIKNSSNGNTLDVFTVVQTGSTTSSNSIPLTSLTPVNSSSEWQGYGTTKFNGTSVDGNTLNIGGTQFTWNRFSCR